MAGAARPFLVKQILNVPTQKKDLAGQRRERKKKYSFFCLLSVLYWWDGEKICSDGKVVAIAVEIKGIDAHLGCCDIHQVKWMESVCCAVIDEGLQRLRVPAWE